MWPGAGAEPQLGPQARSSGVCPPPPQGASESALVARSGSERAAAGTDGRRSNTPVRTPNDPPFTAQKSRARNARRLAERVDYVTLVGELAPGVALPPTVAEVLHRLRESPAGETDWQTWADGTPVTLRCRRHGDGFTFQGQSMSGRFAMGVSAPRWTVEATGRLVLSRGLPASLALMMGVCDGATRWYVARLDMACDVVHAGALEPLSTWAAWCTRAKGAIATYAGRAEGCLTGVSLGKGGQMMLRLYDKTAELATRAEDKRDREHDYWRAHGWNGRDRVHRIEVQLRTRVLRQLQVMAPGDIVAALDGVWGYATRKWARAIVRDDERAERCSVTALWREVQAASWGSVDKTVRERVRKSQGALARQWVGVSLSLLARMLPAVCLRIAHAEDLDQQMMMLAAAVMAIARDDMWRTLEKEAGPRIAAKARCARARWLPLPDTCQAA